MCVHRSRESMRVEGTHDILSGLFLLLRWRKKQGHQLRRKIGDLEREKMCEIVL